VVILGPDELAANQVTVRDLVKKEQQALKRSEAVEFIKQRMG
jgi:histidyl-tRNA synthetase